GSGVRCLSVLVRCLERGVRVAGTEQGPDYQHGHERLPDGYRAVTVTPAGPLHPRRFLTAVAEPPTGVYRVKGTLTMTTVDGPRRYEVGMVGRRLGLRAEGEGPGPGDAAAPEGLVMIGVGLDDDEVSHFLDAAVLGAGESVDADAALGLHPYLVGDP